MSADYQDACEAYEKEEYEKAFELFYALAVDYDVSSQMNIANMFLHGIGVTKDIKKAYSWYEQAAKKEDAEAQYIYGWYCLENTKEIEGIQYMAKSGDAGYADAVYDLASFFLQGSHSCEKDTHKAILLYEQAVSLGKREALNRLFYAKTQENGRLQASIYFLNNIFKFAKSLKQKA